MKFIVKLYTTDIIREVASISWLVPFHARGMSRNMSIHK